VRQGGRARDLSDAMVDDMTTPRGGWACTALTQAGRPCEVPWQLVKDGLCPVHARRVDAAAIGRAGGVASGASRREQARRVRERVEQSRIQAEIDALRLELQELKHEHRESRRRFYRDLVKRRERFIAAAREELREKLKAEGAELRRLRRRRKRLEAATPIRG
jgi:signal transduction histidine kinase